MFASGGHFRTVACPFFASGLCHRPYCHFKHAPELKAAAVTPATAAQSLTHAGVAALAASPPPLKSCDAVDEHEHAGRAIVVAAAPVHRNASQPSYTPTPRQLLSSATAANAAQQQQPPLTYKPTPISELRATAAATSTAARAAPSAAVFKESAGVTPAPAGAAAAPSIAAAPAAVAPVAAAAAGGTALSASGRHRSTATIEYDPEANYRTPEGLVDGGSRRRPSDDTGGVSAAGSRKSKPPVLGRPVEPSELLPPRGTTASALQSGERRWSREDNTVRRVSGESRPSAGADAIAPTAATAAATAATGTEAGQPAICRAVAKAPLSHASTGCSPAVSESDGEAATKNNAVAAVGDRPARTDALQGSDVDRKHSSKAGAARLACSPELSTGVVSRVTLDRGVASIAGELASGSSRSQIDASLKTEALIAEERLTIVRNDQLLVDEQSSSSASSLDDKGTHVTSKFRLKEVRVVLSRLTKENLHGSPLRPKKHAKRRISSSSSSSGSEDIDDVSQDGEPQKKHARLTSKHKFLAAKPEKEQGVTIPSSPSVSQLHNRVDSAENSAVVNHTPVSTKAQVSMQLSKVTGNHFSGSSSTSVTGKQQCLQPVILSSDDEHPNGVRFSPKLHLAEKCSSLASEKKEGPATLGSDPQEHSTGASAAAAQPTLGDGVAKKRIAHNVISSLTKNSPPTIKAVPQPPPPRKLTPAEVLQARYEIQRAKTTAGKGGPVSSEERHPISGTDNKTTAAVTERAVVGAVGQVPVCSTRPTVGKITKSEPRKAHQPSAAVGHLLSRPRIKADGSSSGKVPVNFRQSILDRLVDEAVKTCASIESAYERAVREEAAAYARSGTKDVYRNLMAAAIKKLRDEKAGSSSGSRSVNTASCTLAATQCSPGGASLGSALAGRCASGPTKTSSKSAVKPSFAVTAVVPVSHDQVLLGKAHGNVTLGLKKKERSAVAEITAGALKGPLLCDRLLRYVLTEDQLVENGFPRPAQGAPSGTALIKWSEKYDKRPQTTGEKKCCVRCGKAFVVLPGCIYAKPDEGCSYHWGRRIKKKVTGQVEAIYTCCQSSGNAEACVSAKCHVYDSNKYEDVTGYIETPKNSSSVAAAYAIDCEMVYTTAGIELARVTLIDDNLKEVFDAIVLPSFPIVDCNTRFSGLTEDSFRGVTTTFTQARSRLFEFVSSRTILIGHSLENDLRTLKIFHSRVVDTSVVFPHRMGPPAKCALRDLVAENLMRIIQDDGDTGHDSSADARACMELMKWKVAQDLKKETR